MINYFRYLFLIIFFSVMESFCSDSLQLNKVEFADAHQESNGILVKDTLTNEYKFRNSDNEMVSLNYFATNYMNCLDSNSYKFKRISLYQKMRIVSVVGSVGGFSCFILSMFTWKKAPPQASAAPHTVSMSNGIGIIGISFGLVGAGFNCIGNRILNKIAQED